MSRKITVEFICYAFVILFTYAATSKLLDIELFRTQISQSPLLFSFAGFIAWFVPMLELLIAAALTVPRTRLIALYLSFALMVGFTGYIIAILNFSDFIPCSCGGVLSSLGWTEHLAFNIAFVLLAALGVWLSTRNTKQYYQTH